MPFFPVIIVGAGPAGLLAAISAGKGSLLLERNPAPGKKLLLSGNGQCNFTNSLGGEDFLSRCGKAASFLKPALYGFGNLRFRELLEGAGCPSFERPDGKVFPQSLRAADVRDALVRELARSGAEILNGCLVKEISAGGGFRLETENNGEFTCRALILAGGGCSWPQTGSDGSAYALAKSLGHDIVEPRPALASVQIEGYRPFRDCAGITLKGQHAVFHSSSGKFKASGDLLWTHTGLSGPLILDNSHLLSAGDVISLVLVPRAADRVGEILKLNPKRSLLQALRRFNLPESLLGALLAQNGIDAFQQCASVRRESRLRIVEFLEGLRLQVSSVEGFATAMATSGGVPLSHVRARDLGSRVCPGLYFAGEMLDYDLPTGGFNIQMAASTGFLAGASARESSTAEKKD